MRGILFNVGLCDGLESGGMPLLDSIAPHEANMWGGEIDESGRNVFDVFIECFDHFTDRHLRLLFTAGCKIVGCVSVPSTYNFRLYVALNQMKLNQV